FPLRSARCPRSAHFNEPADLRRSRHREAVIDRHLGDVEWHHRNAAKPDHELSAGHCLVQRQPHVRADTAVIMDGTLQSRQSGSATGTRRYALAFLCAVPLFLTGTRAMDDWSPIRNVVIVTLDTTRADYLPAYGYPGLETPALDRLARDGVVFEQATTSA